MLITNMRLVATALNSAEIELVIIAESSIG